MLEFKYRKKKRIIRSDMSWVWVFIMGMEKKDYGFGKRGQDLDLSIRRDQLK